MPNSLGSSCTADVGGIDWEMSLAGFVFLFSPLPYCFYWSVWRHLAPSQMSVPGVVGAVFFSCWLAGAVSEGRQRGLSSDVWDPAGCSSCWHLAGRVKPGRASWQHPWGAPQDCVWKGEARRGRNACLKRKPGCACSNPALFPLNFSAKMCC